MAPPREIAIEVGNTPECEETFSGPIAAIHTSQVMQWGHFASATAVGFARGLNDTPKILGLTISLSIVTPLQGTLAIGIMMALGGFLAARRVANTLAKKITPMSEQQGLLGNCVTSLLVIGASRLNLPVSTTHVSGGAIFGIGASKASLDLPMVKQILAAWLTTLPIAALLGALLMGSQWL